MSALHDRLNWDNLSAMKICIWGTAAWHAELSRASDTWAHLMFMLSIDLLLLLQNFMTALTCHYLLVSTDPSGASVRYSIPEGLTEYMTVCNSGEKPLAVLYFLTQLKFQRVLCFASSLEATHRYSRSTPACKSRHDASYCHLASFFVPIVTHIQFLPTITLHDQTDRS